MRRPILFLTAAVLLVGACSSGSHKAALQPFTDSQGYLCASGNSPCASSTPLPKATKTPTTGPRITQQLALAVSQDKVGTKHYCSTPDQFCVDYPYVGPDSDNSEFLVSLNPAAEIPAFVGYSSLFWWNIIGGRLAFCAQPNSCVLTAKAGDGGHDEEYDVFVTTDQVRMSLDQLDTDCQGWPNRKATPAVFADESALHVTCGYRAPLRGSKDLFFFRHDGKLYEVATSDQSHTPFFSQQFFNSFRFTD